MPESIEQSWQISKASVTSTRGLVSSQHYLASVAGAEILSAGGNAIDAAVAAGLTLGVVEPWMSGIGGGGYMTLYLADQDVVKVVEFGMQAPLDARADDYHLAGEGTNSGDAFNWPAVTGDTNIHGPLAAAVPGYIKGMSLALENFGTMNWQDLIEPACKQAELGLPIDWFAASKISQHARGLRMYEETARTYLADGLPPAANLEGNLNRLRLGQLASTYRILQNEGPEAYYRGKLASSIVADLAEVGSRITLTDLENYTASISEPLTADYRGSRFNVSGPLTAGPSIIRALDYLQENMSPGRSPDGSTYVAYANALLQAYSHRLTNLGEGAAGNTSHLCVADNFGNVVSLTQTIMSAFGSRTMLPQTGILMNNGMMWFDPRPGGPNSVVGGRKPLCNMCPVIVQGGDNSVTAIGACGGRKIFPAVFQLTSFVADFGMNVNDAAHQPRLDNSGTEEVTVMDHLDPAHIEALKRHFPELRVQPNGVSPNLFALPQIVHRSADGGMEGACFIPSPHARVVSAV